PNQTAPARLPRSEFPIPPPRPLRISDFGFRPSFGLRPSDFGSPASPPHAAELPTRASTPAPFLHAETPRPVCSNGHGTTSRAIRERPGSAGSARSPPATPSRLRQIDASPSAHSQATRAVRVENTSGSTIRSPT